MTGLVFSAVVVFSVEEPSQARQDQPLVNILRTAGTCDRQENTIIIALPMLMLLSPKAQES